MVYDKDIIYSQAGPSSKWAKPCSNTAVSLLGATNLLHRSVSQSEHAPCTGWHATLIVVTVINVYGFQSFPSIIWCVGGILSQSWQENLLELESNLARSTADWKLVIGHHPVRRNNWPSNNMDLLPSLEPILEQYHVQAYFSGHEHNLQYMHQDDSSVHYVITGGGSLTDYSPIVHYDNGGSKFQYWGSGNMAQQPDCSLH